MLIIQLEDGFKQELFKSDNQHRMHKSQMLKSISLNIIPNTICGLTLKTKIKLLSLDRKVKRMEWEREREKLTSKNFYRNLQDVIL